MGLNMASLPDSESVDARSFAFIVKGVKSKEQERFKARIIARSASQAGAVGNEIKAEIKH